MLQSHGAIPQLHLPDPYLSGAAFLIWLVKQGGDEEVSVCEYQWELNKTSNPTPELENVNLFEYLEYLGHELIIKEGEIIKLTPKGSEYAAKWAILYKVSWQNHILVFEDVMLRSIL